MWIRPLQKEMANHPGILTREIPWTEEPGRLQSMESLDSDTTEWLSHQPWITENVLEQNRICVSRSGLVAACFKWGGTIHWTASGTLLRVMWQPGWEGSLGEMETCICMPESLCYLPETITTLIPRYKAKSLKAKQKINFIQHKL